MIVLSTSENLFVLDKATLQIVDKLGDEILPSSPITSSAVIDGKLILQTNQGRYLASSDIISLSRVTDLAPIPNPSLATLSDEEYHRLLQDWRGRGLSLSRVMLDLHSGRFFGAIGVIIYDISAVALLLLAISGIYNFWKLR